MLLRNSLRWAGRSHKKIRKDFLMGEPNGPLDASDSLAGLFIHASKGPVSRPARRCFPRAGPARRGVGVGSADPRPTQALWSSASPSFATLEDEFAFSLVKRARSGSGSRRNLKCPQRWIAKLANGPPSINYVDRSICYEETRTHIGVVSIQ